MVVKSLLNGNRKVVVVLNSQFTNAPNTTQISSGAGRSSAAGNNASNDSINTQQQQTVGAGGKAKNRGMKGKQVGSSPRNGCRHGDHDRDVSTANLHENEKAVPSVQARIEQYLSSDDIQIYVHEKESVPNSLVIYSSLPPRGQELERKILALRIVNQVVRDYPSATSISIWDDEEAAAQIAKNGDQELSWDGYLHRVAFATKDSQGVRVSYALGKDDFENISFGMSPAQ